MGSFTTRILGVLLFVSVAALTAQPTGPSSTGGGATGSAAGAGLAEDLAWLCAPERRGRGADPERTVARWIAGRFEKLGLLPLFGDAFLQGVEVGGFAGANVGGVLPGRNWPADRTHVVVSAHHDHLGTKDGVVYPGAADNASGVAAMLDILRGLTPQAGKLRRSVVFLAFDLEEKGMLGSRAYARDPALPLEDLVVFTTMDILGREVFDAGGDRLVVLGWERSAPLLDLVRGAPSNGDGLEFLFIGADLIGDRSDYAAFRGRRVPFLFFSTGENRDYHRPTDTVDRLNLPLLAKQAAGIRNVIQTLAAIDDRPAFQDEPALRVEEARSMLRILEGLASQAEALPEKVRQELGRASDDLRAAVLAGEVTVATRKRLKTLAFGLMMGLRAGR